VDWRGMLHLLQAPGSNSMLARKLVRDNSCSSVNAVTHWLHCHDTGLVTESHYVSETHHEGLVHQLAGGRHLCAAAEGGRRDRVWSGNRK
jgi:hypothetical protein